VKQEHVLQHNADLLAQAFQIQVAGVDAIQPHRARHRVVEARDQAHQRGFADAGRADKRHHLPGADLDGDIFQHHLSLAVTEADVLEHDLAARTRFQPDGVRSLLDFRAFLQQLIHTISGSQRFLNVLPGIAQRADRLVKHVQVQEESDQIGDVKCTVVNQHAAEIDHYQHAQ